MSTNNGDDQGSGILSTIIKVGSVATAITAIIGLIVLVMQMVEPERSATQSSLSSSQPTQSTSQEPKSRETLKTRKASDNEQSKSSPEPTPEPTPEPSSSPSPTPAPSVPSTGTAVDQWGREHVGAFVLQGEPRSMDPSSIGATDYTVATYQSPSGQQVQYLLAEFSSATEASQVKQQLVDEYVSGQGYDKLGEGPTDSYQGQSLGTYTWLLGNQEMVLWTEENYLLIAQGPYPSAWDFFVAT